MSGWAPIPGTLVIGLGHRARHGKDSAARILIDTFGPGTVQRFSFADDLYAVCRVLHGMRGKDAPLLQRVGLEMRENVGRDVWVSAVYSKLLDARPPVAVITDVRFPNELDFVRALGGACWRVRRLLADGTPYVAPDRPADHVSEVALEHADWDLTIENPDGDPEEFRTRVLCAYQALVLAREEG